MAKLTARTRNKLKSSSFVFPGSRRYPIEDVGHAKDALARVSENGSASEKTKVRAAVRRKYPSMTVEGEPSKKRLDRKSRSRE